MKVRSKGAQFLDRWNVDEKALTFRHRSTGMVVEILCNDQGWSAHVIKPGLTTLRQRERYAQEVGEFFAAATGGKAHAGITREIPANWQWPLLGFDSSSGEVQLRPGFTEDLARLYGISLEELRPDYVSGFLLSWYSSKQAAGDPKDPLMEEVLRYHQQLAQGTTAST